MNAAADADEDANGEKMLERGTERPHEAYSSVQCIGVVAGADQMMNADVRDSGVGSGDRAALQSTGTDPPFSAPPPPYDSVLATGTGGGSAFPTECEGIGNETEMEVDDVENGNDAPASGFVLLDAEEDVETEDDSGSISTVSSIGGSVMSFTRDGGDGSRSESRVTNESAGGRVRTRNKRERVGPMGSPGSRRGRRGGRVN